MPATFGQQFRRERLRLESGGVFDFDAVSSDDQVVASISTSGGKTSSGKLAVGKLHKLRADMLFLIMVNAERRLMVLTEPDMYELCLKEQNGGRVPTGIEFHLVALPLELKNKLVKAREAASLEVRPASVIHK
jgi:hypothetical protein